MLITLVDGDNVRGRDQLLLGEDGTAYLVGDSSSSGGGVNDNTVVAFDTIARTTKWTAPVSNAALNTVLADGSVLLETGSAGSAQLDATGQPTISPLGTAAATLAKPEVCITEFLVVRPA